MSNGELIWMARVSERFLYTHAQFNLALALALALNGQPDAAALNLQRLCSLHRAKRCARRLTEWRELAQAAYTQLAATPFPQSR